MKNNYKKLGDYIRLVEGRNTDLRDVPLMGLSINKVFIPSIANTIGTNMATYRIIKRRQFAYGSVTSRNGDKITIALFDDCDEAMISQAYTPFEVSDTEKLLPEYLMMWFRRPDFDRYARFKSHGSAREIFSWEEMQEVRLPIPHIEKQREIVAEYNAIQNRIQLNEQLIQKLEETAQAIYRQWFVEFEFPHDFGHSELGSESTIKPYKSNGGEMVWCEKLGKEIPKGWVIIELKDIIENYDSKRIPLASSDRANRDGKYPYYGAASLMDYVDEYIFDGAYILLGEDGTVVTEKGTPVLQYVWGKFWVNNHAHVLKGRNGFDENSLYVLLSNTNITDIITGGVQAKINQANLNSISIIKSNSELLEVLNKKLKPIFELFKSRKTENLKLTELKGLLLSKLAQSEMKKEK